MGDDKDLAIHQDASDLTFNLCLGTEFTGASLRFFYPDAMGGNQMAEHHHTVGYAVVHKGSIHHDVRPLQSGERENLVIWCRHRPPLPGQSRTIPPP
mmetsp:Transcript_13735/g.32523  ORF Transcript_13735/g.32523 Transcript_13735/m.32523 type:complete len:97 (-) Transcript_13735:95-385(-)